MIRSFISLTKKGFQAPRIVARPSFIFTPKYFFATPQVQDSYSELRILAKIVGTQYFKHNDEVVTTNEIKLLDNNNKLLGIYNINQAKKKCKELKMDLVLINPNTRPIICKAMDYKEDLYKKFVKDVFEKDLPKISKEIQKTADLSKSIKLGSKMTIADLRNKAATAQGIAKQVKNVRIYMNVTEEAEESGRNVMFTFRDLTKDFLMPKGEIHEIEVNDEEEEGIFHKKQAEDEEGDKFILAQEFQSYLFSDQRIEAAQKSIKDYTEEEIKEIINQYIQREIAKSKLDSAVDFFRGKGDSEFDNLVSDIKGDEKKKFPSSKEVTMEEFEAALSEENKKKEAESLAGQEEEDIYGDIDAVKDKYRGKNEFQIFLMKEFDNLEEKANMVRKLEVLRRNIEQQNKRRGR